jgi:hypothetical protein
MQTSKGPYGYASALAAIVGVGAMEVFRSLRADVPEQASPRLCAVYYYSDGRTDNLERQGATVRIPR